MYLLYFVFFCFWGEGVINCTCETLKHQGITVKQNTCYLGFNKHYCRQHLLKIIKLTCLALRTITRNPPALKGHCKNDISNNKQMCYSQICTVYYTRKFLTSQILKVHIVGLYLTYIQRLHIFVEVDHLGGLGASTFSKVDNTHQISLHTRLKLEFFLIMPSQPTSLCVTLTLSFPSVENYIYQQVGNTRINITNVGRAYN